MQRDSWPLLALSFASEKRLTPVQLQKTLFLVGQYVIDNEANYYHFEPYHYGPFDARVYSDLDALTDRGLVRKIQSPSFRGFDYELTALGTKKAEAARRSLKAAQTLYLKRVVPWVLSLTFRQLVSSIYRTFPDMAVNSVFRY